jgi:hypothetical protein
VFEVYGSIKKQAKTNQWGKNGEEEIHLPSVKN